MATRNGTVLDHPNNILNPAFGFRSASIQPVANATPRPQPNPVNPDISRSALHAGQGTMSYASSMLPPSIQFKLLDQARAMIHSGIIVGGAGKPMSIGLKWKE